MTLRLRLTLAIVVFVACGLLVAGAVTYRSLDTFLLNRIDQQLRDAQDPVAFALFSGEPPPGMMMPGAEGNQFFPSGTVGEVVDAGGNVVVGPKVFTYGQTGQPVPRVLPGTPALSRAMTFDVPATGDPSFRFRALSLPLQAGHGTFIVAIPLTEVIDTLHRLLLVEALVAASVLAGLGLLTWLAVRRELRPLRDMAETAAAIATGDLSERVGLTDPHTEVGRLGTALNSMLVQIEVAFAERRASEDRLRRFLADASHELRTPLTSIRGYSELYRRTGGADADATEDSMRRIEQEASRMGVLVDDLLLLARLDQGRPLEMETVDLARVVRDGVSDARAVDPSRDISYEGAGSVFVLGDEVRLRQVVGNLLSNALKHTPPGTSVRTRLTPEGDRVVFEVSDLGHGLSEADRSEIFEPFYRADSGRARDNGGVGLGLAIVAATVKAHGGRVEAAEAPGGGALFRVTLPAEADRPDGP